MNTTNRIPFEILKTTFANILIQRGFEAKKAKICAELFSMASLDGVASHGLNRFPAFLEQVEGGRVIPEAEPVLEFSLPIMERWDGQLGAGMYNASFAMKRAAAMAIKNGMGCVALNNTNHWMRAGNYGWQAAEAGCISICFTNTIPNMPAWGGKEPKLGNNPLVIGLPYKNKAVILDTAMTQYSYGKMAIYKRSGKQLPYAAGFDAEGQLSKNPIEVIAEKLPLPIGLWKGAGLSLMLDLLASGLSDGQSSQEIGRQQEEYGVSQFFLCIHPEVMGISKTNLDGKIEHTIADLKQSKVFDGMDIHFPGEQSFIRREENLRLGVPVDADIWGKVCRMMD
ncbi:3-dehydro-L-gulonate 2-dehydrogenase [Cyclobacterium marinum]|uniref:Malate/L-lactate dehydrogenase n=1 Tax=Cyclobacterium marinum (strain ATCC 25205 / DSM 745 / LMG 13164 / NCIMB 1802) TaxID=880070 RepID=G0IWA2_CYCMS|nr:3-dehydro-L-gulonate 2-dehydrogenase [Cyclobacterium marinum]AEL27090.1 Malate/L-lactate dehydrogenase [Cyclobacterium marinum DSM 745]MBR9776633.1 3-dehydro-L-gulonate 2-dehydrogenase [Cytophagales bacterium]|tara:strand:+ start:97015 stop:98031 length:1017 start_codon:yes stop_codon:yes gene_type:complete